MIYTNPILPGFYPDPSVCRVGQDYFLVTSSFEYFPGVPIFHSRDLVRWKQIGHVLNRKSQLNLDGAKSSGGIYAPTIRHHDGRFYVVTTDTTGIGNFYVHADHPAGEWSEPILVKQGGIDPSLFFDDDGRIFFAGNGLFAQRRGLYLNEIEDIATGRLRFDEPRFLWEGTGGKYPEAPHIYKRGGWYYLLIAEGGTETGHMISVARSKDPYGPYESCPRNPILSHRSTDKPIQSTGHGDLVEDHEGRWWMVLLGVRHHGYPLVHHLGRETYLTPIDWTDDGWPRVNGGRMIDLQMTVPGLMSEAKVASLTGPASVRDDFDSPDLAPQWNFRRNPDPQSWSLSTRRGHLVLRCMPATLFDVASPAFVGRRQQHFIFAVETAIDFAPAGEGEEAGLTVIMNERYHTDLFITRRQGRRCIVLRRSIGSLVAEVKVHAIEDEERVRLRVHAEDAWYHFSFASGAADAFVEMGDAETRHHSTEIAGGFTGVYIGMYATANGAPSTTSGYFDYFNYLSPGDKANRTLEPVTQKPKPTKD